MIIPRHPSWPAGVVAVMLVIAVMTPVAKLWRGGANQTADVPSVAAPAGEAAAGITAHPPPAATFPARDAAEAEVACRAALAVATGQPLSAISAKTLAVGAVETTLTQATGEIFRNICRIDGDRLAWKDRNPTLGTGQISIVGRPPVITYGVEANQVVIVTTYGDGSFRNRWIDRDDR